MMKRAISLTPEAFHTFGDLLTYLRKQARLTQEELGRAAGYSRTQITRLEKNQRSPDLAAVAALFIPALQLSASSPWAAHLLQLAASARGAMDGRPRRVQARPGVHAGQDVRGHLVLRDERRLPDA